MKPTQAQFAAYQQIFDYFNRTLFDNSLPDCMLSFSRRRSSSNTLFTAGQWQEEWAEKMIDIGLIPSATGLPGGKRTGRGIKHYIKPDGRFEKAFREMPADYLWPFLPAVFECQKSKGYSEKVSYHCIGCGAKVWGKDGLELLCGCGQVFASETGETKAGLAEKIYHILAEQYG